MTPHVSCCDLVTSGSGRGSIADAESVVVGDDRGARVFGVLSHWMPKNRALTARGYFLPESVEFLAPEFAAVEDPGPGPRLGAA